MHNAVYELLRIPILRTRVNKRLSTVPLDAALYDPLPLGISVSYKRGETEKAMASPHG
jgi:hypothetical protein